ncbi:DUF1501 domain-containing protein [Paludisphaera borealis]|uniref:DUF1501 domain-containing protein n=1 Tax=Paludisphaera borealis TaxID=1387353 RepID=A0A1U7CN12_9BACT|nr:DUF1501 domain-containing protein [Paludisphaera borealis]APW60325.1 hypothetical protein BSF38_01793 [Paludisphaera borealis]
MEARKQDAASPEKVADEPDLNEGTIMFDLMGAAFGNCSGVTRRNLLRAGVLGFTGLSLADMLKAKALADAAGTKRKGSDETSVILIWLDGGPPQHETYDPKPDAPEQVRGPIGSIRTKVPGIRLSELLPRHAANMDKIALLRSMHHDNGDHFAAAHWMLTGYLGSNAVNQTPQFPSFGSIISRMKGSTKPGLPPYVGLPNTHSVGIPIGYHGAAYLGRGYDPFNADGDPNSDAYRATNLDLPSGVDTGRLCDRRDLLTSFDSARRGLDKSLANRELDQFQSAAFDMMSGPAARAAFDMKREDPRLRDRYGRHTWGQSALLGRRLVEAGVRFVTLTFGGWDWHSSIEKGMHNVLPILDAAVATLIEDLDQRGMLETTIVLVMGEFGRTPVLNKGLPNDSVPGRDHWGNVMSVLAAGGGFQGGQAIGASDARGAVPADRPITPQDLASTLYHRLGLDLSTTFNDRTGRPVSISSNGQVITELGGPNVGV